MIPLDPRIPPVTSPNFLVRLYELFKEYAKAINAGWYESGSWTPTVTAGSGTFTTVSATGEYVKTGRKVSVTFDVSITTNGTAAQDVRLTLPFVPSAFSVGSARERATSFAMCQAVVNSTVDLLIISKYDNTYPGGSGYQIVGNATYFV